MALREIQQQGDEGKPGLMKGKKEAPAPQPQGGKHLVVPGSSRVDLLARVPERGYEVILDGRVHVLVRALDEELALAVQLDEPGELDATAIERTSIKAHGCCRYEQGPIDAILDLRARHGFGSQAVEAVRLGVLSAGWGNAA